MPFLSALTRRSGSKEKAEAGWCLGGSVPDQVTVPTRRTRSVVLETDSLTNSMCGQQALHDISKNAATKIPPFILKASTSIASSDAPWKKTEDSEAASEYMPDMLGQLFSKQFAYMANPEYMQTQGELNAKMRSVLIDWLIEVHADYKMNIETLFLTSSLIDRYLSRKSAPRGKLQLIGVVALLVAAKFEEMHPPKVDNLVYITDNAYSKAEIMRVECTFLATLGFEVMGPTCDHFFSHFQQLNGCDAFQLELVRYLLELSLLEISMLRYEPSRVAAASILLSNELLGRSPTWPQAMAAETRHSALGLSEVVGELRMLLEAAPASALQAVRKKYSKDTHLAVATAFPRAR